MFGELWSNQEIPGHDGVLQETGNLYSFENYRLKAVQLNLEDCDEPESVAIFDRCAINNSPLEVLCGEGLSYGSNGFVLLLNTDTNIPVWTFLSSETNPFYKVIDTGQYIISLSTSGTIFRFKTPNLKEPLKDVFLSIP